MTELFARLEILEKLQAQAAMLKSEQMLATIADEISKVQGEIDEAEMFFAQEYEEAA